MKWPIVLRRVTGHSMMPVLPPGTLVWGWGWFRDIRKGDVVIFLHDDREKIKRITEIKDAKLFVEGDHPEASKDSRQFGYIPKESVVARLIWPRAPKERAEGYTSPDK